MKKLLLIIPLLLLSGCASTEQRISELNAINIEQNKKCIDAGMKIVVSDYGYILCRPDDTKLVK